MYKNTNRITFCFRKYIFLQTIFGGTYAHFSLYMPCFCYDVSTLVHLTLFVSTFTFRCYPRFNHQTLLACLPACLCVVFRLPFLCLYNPYSSCVCLNTRLLRFATLSMLVALNGRSGCFYLLILFLLDYSVIDKSTTELNDAVFFVEYFTKINNNLIINSRNRHFYLVLKLCILSTPVCFKN
jgi:hypothetical protein